jgi:hypothetical protein
MKKRVETKNCPVSKMSECNSGGIIYGLGFIGSLVYYISTATSFWIGVLGVLKSFLWPAFIIYEIMKYISA